MNILPAVFTNFNGFIPCDVVINSFVGMHMAENASKALLMVSGEG